MRRRLLLLVALFVVACNKPSAATLTTDASGAPPVMTGPSSAVPPALSLSDFADAATATATASAGQSPYDQALAYEANGQYWLARIAIEKKALGADGTKEEVELLGRICHAQHDDACASACEKKLGRKIRFDAGAPAAVASGAVPKEPDTEAARAREMLLRSDHKGARKLLEPKVLDGRASPEEIRMLRVVCKQEADRMCVALCDAKLGKP